MRIIPFTSVCLLAVCAVAEESANGVRRDLSAAPANARKMASYLRGLQDEEETNQETEEKDEKAGKEEKGEEDVDEEDVVEEGGDVVVEDEASTGDEIVEEEDVVEKEQKGEKGAEIFEEDAAVEEEDFEDGEAPTEEEVEELVEKGEKGEKEEKEEKGQEDVEDQDVAGEQEDVGGDEESTEDADNVFVEIAVENTPEGNEGDEFSPEATDTDTESETTETIDYTEPETETTETIADIEPATATETIADTEPETIETVSNTESETIENVSEIDENDGEVTDTESDESNNGNANVVVDDADNENIEIAETVDEAPTGNIINSGADGFGAGIDNQTLESQEKSGMKPVGKALVSLAAIGVFAAVIFLVLRQRKKAKAANSQYEVYKDTPSNSRALALVDTKETTDSRELVPVDNSDGSTVSCTDVVLAGADTAMVEKSDVNGALAVHTPKEGNMAITLHTPKEEGNMAVVEIEEQFVQLSRRYHTNDTVEM